MILPKRCRDILYENFSTDPYLISRLPKNSFNFFLDIGASYGLVSILAKLVHPKSKVVAVEPDIDVFNNLKNNVSNLGLHLLNGAYGNGNDFVLLKERKTPLNNMYWEGSTVTDKKIKSYTLDNLIQKFNIIPENTLLKVDCEGSERFLLLEDCFKRFKIITIEAHEMEGLSPLQDLCDKIGNLFNTHKIFFYSSLKVTLIHLIRHDIYGDWYEV